MIITEGLICGIIAIAILNYLFKIDEHHEGSWWN